MGSETCAGVAAGRVRSGAAALAVAVVATAFVLGRGPGSLILLSHSGQAPTRLPFAGAGLGWLPGHDSLSWAFGGRPAPA